MRRQYHSRKTDRGVLIWDVHRLVELSRDFPRFEHPLSKIRELDECFWFSESDAVPTCREVALHAKLISETDLQYPIILSSDGRVMDGMHRVCKALMRGDETILAVQFATDPEPDHVDVPLDELSYDDLW